MRIFRALSILGVVLSSGVGVGTGCSSTTVTNEAQLKSLLGQNIAQASAVFGTPTHVADVKIYAWLWRDETLGGSGLKEGVILVTNPKDEVSFWAWQTAEGPMEPRHGFLSVDTAASIGKRR